ncbi:DNA double-strand break repair nuclease NurA [candidate division KSB1 bacterium]|nr:DNA double-strand break repair nuclease NurA [candidate division KSB1 bacterium]
MNKKDIPDSTIDAIAEHINRRSNQPARVPIITIDGDTSSPHYFEITPFDQIDSSENKYFAIDGSYNSQEFYNGIYVGLYTAGYVCFQKGKQIRLNEFDDPVILGKSYFPENILITNDEHRHAVFDELLELDPVKNLLKFFETAEIDLIWGLGKETRNLVCTSISKLLSFCQEVLEWSLVLEILESNESKPGDFVLRDGTLRSNNIKQRHLVKLGQYAKEKGVYVIGVTKNSPIKLELSSSFKKIDNYLETEKKPSYPFTIKHKQWQKLCCWFEVSDDVLLDAYPEADQKRQVESGAITKPTKYSMFATSNLNGGRGFGLFFVARLDYVEKLQNYDWVVIDINIFDAIPTINDKMNEQAVRKAKRDIQLLAFLFKELTRLTQEHYILGYPYPLVEAHNFVTLRKNFKDEIIKRVKASLYQSQRMDHVDIENMFLDIHERF